MGAAVADRKKAAAAAGPQQREAGEPQPLAFQVFEAGRKIFIEVNDIDVLRALYSAREARRQRLAEEREQARVGVASDSPAHAEFYSRQQQLDAAEATIAQAEESLKASRSAIREAIKRGDDPSDLEATAAQATAALAALPGRLPVIRELRDVAERQARAAEAEAVEFRLAAQDAERQVELRRLRVEMGSELEAWLKQYIQAGLVEVRP